MTIDLNFVRALVTVLALGAFLAIVVWAYVPRRKSRLDAEARRILEEAER
jgi:cbb3-type cytochrome oxidase subunit 3